MLKKSLFTIVLILSIFCLGGCDMEEQKDVGVGEEKWITPCSATIEVNNFSDNMNLKLVLYNNCLSWGYNPTVYTEKINIGLGLTLPNKDFILPDDYKDGEVPFIFEILDENNNSYTNYKIIRNFIYSFGFSIDIY